MKKPFFFRVEAGELLAEVITMNEKERGKWVLSFALALQKCDSSHSTYVSKLIQESTDYIGKKKEAAHKRWNAPHMQIDAPHIHRTCTAMPEAVTVTEAVTISEEQKTKPKTSGARFTPPTIEEVQSYCLERKNGVDANKWHSYYSANGWKVGKNSMKDWQAAVRTWEGKQPFPHQGKLADTPSARLERTNHSQREAVHHDY